MIGQYLITFREVLEAALITSIILAYFIRTEKKYLVKYVWMGITFAVIVSIIIAIVVSIIYGGLSSAASKLFEGLTALIAVIVLTSMILWMALKGKFVKEEITERISHTVEKGTVIGLFFFSFTVIFREGVETVLFLIPFGASDPAGTIGGGLLGFLSALLISYLIFKIGVTIRLHRFFYFTSIILVLLAAGLLGYGVHEMISYQNAIGNDSGWLGAYAFNLNIPEGSLIHHKGAIGSILAVMFGYSVKMEWGRIIAHVTYLLVFLPLTMLAYRKPEYFDSLRQALKKMKWWVDKDPKVT